MEVNAAMKTGLTLFPAAASLALLAAAFFLCSGCYTLSQGVSLLGILSQARPLDTLTGDGGEGRAFVERVADIRRFALDEIGLADTKNYTTYVALDREYLAAVVSACAADSFTRHQWRFPIVGAVPYKGFFNVAGAKKEAGRLRKRGLDVWVRGVDAFSLLGFFREPLYSYMRDYPVHRLADLLIHELTHATVFFKSDADFNEAFAEFVGQEGSRLYLERRFGRESAEYQAMLDVEAKGAAYRERLRGLGAALEAVYADPVLSREEKLSGKAALLAEWNDPEGGFDTSGMNNAYIDLYRLYYDSGAGLREKFEVSGGNLRAFVAAAKAGQIR